MKGQHANHMVQDEIMSASSTKLMSLLAERFNVDLSQTKDFNIHTEGKQATIEWTGVAFMSLSEFNEIFAKAQE